MGKEDNTITEKDLEALEMYEYWAEKKERTHEDVGDHFDYSKSHAGRMVRRGKKIDKKLQQKQMPRTTPGDGGDGTHDLVPKPSGGPGGALAKQDVTQIISTLSTDEETSEKMGTIAGIDLNTVTNQARRTLEGQASKTEMAALAKNIVGMVNGWQQTQDAFNELEGESKDERQEDLINAFKEALSEMSEEEKTELLGGE